MRFSIPGEPIAKKRPRFYNGRAIDLQDTEKKAVKVLLQSIVTHLSDKDLQEAERIDQERACTCSMTFYQSIEASASIRQRNAKLWSLEKNYSSTREDVDNLAKFYLDCMNGIIYDDDRFIMDLTCKKRYALTPRTIIEILPMERPTLTLRQREVLVTFTPDALHDFVRDIHTLARSECVNRVYTTPKNRLAEQLEESQDLADVADQIATFAESWSELLKKSIAPTKASKRKD